MNISRRVFMGASAAAISTGISEVSLGRCPSFNLAHPTNGPIHQWSRFPSTYAVIPVVSDGKWIWGKPPKGETGYLEPREYEFSTGVSFTGRGRAVEVKASTVAPVGFPEQEILDFGIKTVGCAAKVVQLAEGAAQLLIAAPRLEAGQTISALAKYRMKICKVYHGYSKERFPQQQDANRIFGKRFLRDSPGIETNIPEVKNLVGRLIKETMHPWEKAETFYKWVWDNVKGVPGKYTSIKQAIKNRKGDCEERATVFIALCRAAGIPARLVWVPSHNWAEIGLHDHDRLPHWIPVHTAAYSWFGWTGAHELILQKGDHIRIAHRKRTLRLIDDWYRVKGTKPDMYYFSKVTPVAPEGTDPGPGARIKLKSGQWELAGNHPANKFMRDK